MAPWLKGPVIDEINNLPDLSVLRLEWSPSEGPEDDDALKVLNNLPRLASSLHTLSLTTDFQPATVLLSLDFPHLKFLRLRDFKSLDDTEKVQSFFERHPQLETLSLESCIHTWFSENIEVGFLPNLKHLKARFEDIRLLVPILPQLVSLGFTKSDNAQVPYLLRAVLPNGLPKLKSLEIEQEAPGWDACKLEGALWYETLDGEFRTELNFKKMARDFTKGYMHSIVRGAPNLEELGLHGVPLSSACLKNLHPTFSQFVKMERFYYYGYSPDPKYGNAPHPRIHEKALADFLASAEALARSPLSYQWAEADESPAHGFRQHTTWHSTTPTLDPWHPHNRQRWQRRHAQKRKRIPARRARTGEDTTPRPCPCPVGAPGTVRRAEVAERRERNNARLLRPHGQPHPTATYLRVHINDTEFGAGCERVGVARIAGSLARSPAAETDADDTRKIPSRSGESIVPHQRRRLNPRRPLHRERRVLHERRKYRTRRRRRIKADRTHMQRRRRQQRSRVFLASSSPPPLSIPHRALIPLLVLVRPLIARPRFPLLVHAKRGSAEAWVRRMLQLVAPLRKNRLALQKDEGPLA
ncbi:hypothetical protein BJ912DRAFT_1042670, partial [Pholiota molesta]